MKFKNLSYEVNDFVGVLRFNRPKAFNALNKELISEFKTFLDSFDSSQVRVLVLTGGDKAFIAGADIKELKGLSKKQAFELSEVGQNVLDQLVELPVPTIAAVHGYALGGGFEVALACDFIMCSDKAQFALPEVSLGLIPGYGGTQRLSRLAGLGVARRVALSGEMVTAQQAYEWGISTAVFKSDIFLQEVVKFSKKFMKNAPKAMSCAKSVINLGHTQTLPLGLKLERNFFSECFESNESVEGIEAFIEKKSPQYALKSK